ncbi:predicted protein [Nematostella vectensis]|uniref:Tetraspanin n=1 Tax=Nematostella vectensis TaxID=45351 RepID=A7RLE8_NEMVE|nr:tetraspanin-9 [Nematostella vectensis]XP_032220733.1 tetraspanin-9 [Nematostella vectensis]EDO47592.1 predicted protein [Nematostella vectensis]|eukprot:XP_001639655.1 predicted protein [Nematostella vectensis]
MAMEGAANCIKYMVFLFNFIFFLGGVGLMGVGIYVQLKIGDYVELQSVKYITGSIIIIAVGAFIALVSFFGCCGAIKEHRCLLATFFALLFIILAVEITGTALGYVYRNKVEEQLGKDMNDTIVSYGEKGKEGITDAYDAIQKKEKCCGINGFKDWQRSYYTKGNHSIVPDSCCKTVSKGCGINFKENDIYTKGCFDTVKTLLKDNLIIIGGIGIGVAVIQILAMIFAMVLVCKIGAQSEYA